MLFNHAIDAVLYTLPQTQWQTLPDESAVKAIEGGKVLFFPNLNFQLIHPEETSLLSPIFSNGRSKNISFNTTTQTLKGVKATPNQKIVFKNLLNRYSAQSTSLVQSLIPAYKSALRIGRTSLRLVEIQDRQTPSYRKDDTRLHIDAFPANPNQGYRILRVFCNIHETKHRLWHLGESFEKVAHHFLPEVPKQIFLSSFFLKNLKITKSRRTAYDHIMLNIHNRMKKNIDYQRAVKYTEIAFPAQSTWMVYTDKVSHAVLSGQNLLEQTFYLPVHAMLDESKSPLRILEKMTSKKLVG